MKIKNDLTNKVNDIDTSEIWNILSRIRLFIIYDEYVQSYIPDDYGNPGLKAISKRQNVNAWSSKCNYLINHIRKDFERCLKLIEEDQDLFVGFRISEKTKRGTFVRKLLTKRNICSILVIINNNKI